jgi:hypothetical protein
LCPNCWTAGQLKLTPAVCVVGTRIAKAPFFTKSDEPDQQTTAGLLLTLSGTKKNYVDFLKKVTTLF